MKELLLVTNTAFRTINIGLKSNTTKYLMRANEERTSTYKERSLEHVQMQFHGALATITAMKTFISSEVIDPLKEKEQKKTKKK